MANKPKATIEQIEKLLFDSDLHTSPDLFKHFTFEEASDIIFNLANLSASFDRIITLLSFVDDYFTGADIDSMERDEREFLGAVSYTVKQKIIRLQNGCHKLYKEIKETYGRVLSTEWQAEVMKAEALHSLDEKTMGQFFDCVKDNVNRVVNKLAEADNWIPL